MNCEVLHKPYKTRGLSLRAYIFKHLSEVSFAQEPYKTRACLQKRRRYLGGPQVIHEESSSGCTLSVNGISFYQKKQEKEIFLSICVSLLVVMLRDTAKQTLNSLQHSAAYCNTWPDVLHWGGGVDKTSFGKVALKGPKSPCDLSSTQGTAVGCSVLQCVAVVAVYCIVHSTGWHMCCSKLSLLYVSSVSLSRFVAVHGITDGHV